MKPTQEQGAAIEAFGQGGTLVLDAGAGTGKTTTLKLLATQRPKERGIYLAYNRAIADSAKKSFPVNVKCGTAHSFAYGAIGHSYRHRLDARAVRAKDIATMLDLSDQVQHEKLVLDPFQLARLVMSTVKTYCSTTAGEITLDHVTFPLAADTDEAQAAVAEIVLPYAERAWVDLQTPEGRLPFSSRHLPSITGPRTAPPVHRNTGSPT